MSKHTQGPWDVYSKARDEGMTEYFGIDAVGGLTVVLWDPSGGILKPEDARLISAAPDLLAALHAVLTASGDDETLAAYKAARAAIAKAEDTQMSNTIWIVRKHPRHRFGDGPSHIQEFTIHMATSDKSAARAEAARKNASKTTTYLYTVGKVTAKAGDV